MKRTLFGSVAVIMAIVGPLAVPEAHAQSVYRDWQNSYDFPTAADQAVNLSRAQLIKLTEEGFFDHPPSYTTNQYVKQNFYKDCSADGSCPENYATSIGNQVITTVSCTKGASCVGIESGSSISQDNIKSKQSSSVSTSSSNKNVNVYVND